MARLKQTSGLYVGTTLIVVLGALGIAQTVLQGLAAAEAQSAVQAPRFEVDPL